MEIVADTGAEVNIISDSCVKRLGLNVERTKYGANQVNKTPLNVVGLVTLDIFYGDSFKFQFQGLVCSDIGNVIIGGNPLLAQGITPVPYRKCILLENN